MSSSLMTGKSNHSEPGFALLFASTKPLEVEAAISYLDEEGIHSFKINKKDSSYIFGEIELYVEEDQLTRAQIILTENNLL